ncbi:MAG: amino acid permease [Candidatus Aminicenantes bacterium]|nr:amino acid permease [Candidatus Aminicenantes bacterium]
MSNSQKSASASPGPVQLARHLGVFEATMIGVGAMIGAGIFVLTGMASGNAGPGALLAFGLNGVVTLFTALSYAELSSAIPEAGGGYSFVKKVMPNMIAFTSGWMLWCAYLVACSLYAKGFGSYLMEFFHRYTPQVREFLVNLIGRGGSIALFTSAVAVLFIIINIMGTHASGKAENVITLTKIIILGVFIFFGLKQVFSAPQTVQANFKPFLPLGFSGVIAAMGLTFIAFEGYDLIATISEEVREPRKTIPRAILYSLGITVLIYILVVFVSLGAVAPAENLPVWKLLGKYKEIGIIRAAQSFMPKFGVVLIIGGGLFATLSALNATIMASSRVAFSMGRDWMLPNKLSRIHSIKKTPVMSIVVSGVIFISAAVFLPLEIIGVASSLLFLITFSLVNIALIIYRQRSPAGPSRFKVPLYPIPPLLGILTSVGLALYQLFHQTLAFGLAVGWIAIGVLIYVALFSKRVRIADVPKIIESPELLALKRTRSYKILVPIANPERVEPLIQMAGEIATASKGEILSLNVIEMPSITEYEEAEPFLNEAQIVLNRAQKMAFNQKVNFSSLTKIARSVAPEIVRVAKENECKLILMGYKQEKDPLENSLIHHVVSHQPCDVAILKSDVPFQSPIESMLIPIGGKEIHDSLKVRLIHCLYRQEKPDVTLLTVVPPDCSRIQRRRAEEALKRARKVFDIPKAELLVRENDEVADAVIKQANECDLMILGMRDEPRFKSFFFGTLAQQIAGQVRCPTLLTKAKSKTKSRMKRLLRIKPDVVEEPRSEDECPV